MLRSNTMQGKSCECWELKSWLENGHPGYQGGEKQRVAIARALINNPSILMGDEPTGNLDSYNAENVFQIFQRLKAEQGLSLLVVTHDKDFADRSDRIIVMEDGRLRS